MRYIPAFLQPRPRTFPWSETSSFTLQNEIDPKKIVKRYKIFKFNKYVNEFGFCDESGVEYFVYCYKQGDDKIKIWGTVVTISDSLDPVGDVHDFSSWLYDNFGSNLNLQYGGFCQEKN